MIGGKHVNHYMRALFFIMILIPTLLLGKDSLSSKTMFSFGIETKAFYRHKYSRAVFPIMPLIPTLEIGKKLNSTQTIALSIGYSLPVNIGSESNYAFLYNVRAFFISAGIKQNILSSKRLNLLVSLSGIGRIGSIRWNTNVVFNFPPPPEFDEAIPDMYRIDGLGLGFKASIQWFLSAKHKTGIAIEYGLDKYIFGITSRRYSFNETVSAKFTFAF